MKHIQRFFLSIFLLAFTETCLAVPAGVNWQWANPTPQGNPFNAVTYNSASTTSVAVGDLGNIVSSSNGGLTWTVRTSGTAENLNAVSEDDVFIGQIYVVGDKGTIISSAGLSKWSQNSSGTINNLNGVVFNQNVSNPLFIAVGDNGTVLTNDGSTSAWTVAPVPAGIGNLTAVVWSGTIFVAVSDNGTIIASPNGTSWTKENFTTGSLFALNGFRAVTWSGSQFVAVGDAGLIETSTTGANWTQQTSGTNRNLYSVASSGSVYIATSTSGVIFTSSNATSWTPAANGTTGVSESISLLSIMWDGSRFIAAGSGATLLTSPAGSTWTQRYPVTVTDQSLFGVSWSQSLSKYFVTGNSNTLLVSSDGINWTLVSGSTPPTMNDIVDNGALLVGVDAQGKAYSSSDGNNWSAQPTGNTNTLNAIAWDGSQFVAVGNSGTVLTSSNGTAWVAQASATVAHLQDIAWNGLRFVAVGSGIVISSPDGLNWMPTTVTQTLRSVTSNGGLFVAVGINGAISSSPDGLNWTVQSSGTTSSLFQVGWTGVQFIAVGTNGVIITSLDGANWFAQTTNASAVTFSGVTGNKAHSIAVGTGGAILTGVAGYSVGGTIAGLKGTLVLQNNGGDDLTVSAAGDFTFASSLVQDATYDVSILASPSNQTCNLISGKGAVDGASVTSVSISCSDNPVSTGGGTTSTSTGSGGGGGSFSIYLIALLSSLIVFIRRKPINIAVTQENVFQ